MARMPGAQWVGPHHDNGTMTRYDVVCIHTIVGYAPAHAAQFSTKAGGTIFQSRDTHYRSAANLHGNHRVIAIENEDHGPAYGPWSGSDVPPLTDQQIEACAKICAWAYKVHGIPLVACPDSKPGSRGIAYHRQGIDGNFGTYRYGGRVAGGELWSSWFGKVCPGDKRIAQIPQIITRARQLAGLEEDDMPLSKEDVERVARATATELMNRDGVPTPYGNKDNPRYKVKYAMAGAWDHAFRAQKAAEQSVRQLATLAGRIAALEEAHRQEAAGESVDYDRVTAAAEAGARAAIESSVLDVDITVNDKGDVA